MARKRQRAEENVYVDIEGELEDALPRSVHQHTSDKGEVTYETWSLRVEFT